MTKEGHGSKRVSVQPCGGSTRGHVRNYEEIRLTSAGVLGYPAYEAGAEEDTWDLLPWKRVCGVDGIEDPSEVPEDVVVDPEERPLLCAKCGEEPVFPGESDLSPPVCESCRREISGGPIRRPR